jgi:hypothetical protein
MASWVRWAVHTNTSEPNLHIGGAHRMRYKILRFINNRLMNPSADDHCHEAGSHFAEQWMNNENSARP